MRTAVPVVLAPGDHTNSHSSSVSARDRERGGGSRTAECRAVPTGISVILYGYRTLGYLYIGTVLRINDDTAMKVLAATEYISYLGTKVVL